MRLFFDGRRTGFLERCRDQIVSRPAAVKKREHMKVCVALAYHLDPSLVFYARQFGHDKVLLGDTHITIIDVERETGRMRRRIDRNGIAIESPEPVLILLRSDKRTHRQRTIKLALIRRRDFLLSS